MKHYLIIDGNSIGFAAHNTTVLTVAGKQVQAIFGFLRTVRKMVETYGSGGVLILWDGKSWRKEAYSFYKADRDKDPKIAAARAHYKTQRPSIARACKLLGLPQLFAPNLEADDLAGMLVPRAVAKGARVTMATGDQDWLQLVQPGVVWMDFVREKIVTTKNFQEFTGYVNAAAFLQGKALRGDSSDKIPGVGGIGEKGAAEMLEKWGSVEGFLEAFNGGKIEKPGKKLVTFATNAAGGVDNFHRNMEIMDLRSPAIPKPTKLHKTAKPLDEEGFTEFCAELAFHSILRELDKWLTPFKKGISHA